MLITPLHLLILISARTSSEKIYPASVVANNYAKQLQYAGLVMIGEDLIPTITIHGKNTLNKLLGVLENVCTEKEP